MLWNQAILSLVTPILYLCLSTYNVAEDGNCEQDKIIPAPTKDFQPSSQVIIRIYQKKTRQKHKAEKKIPIWKASSLGQWIEISKSAFSLTNNYEVEYSVLLPVERGELHLCIWVKVQVTTKTPPPTSRSFDISCWHFSTHPSWCTIYRISRVSKFHMKHLLWINREGGKNQI